MKEQTKIMKKHLEELERLKENASENYIKDEITEALCKTYKELSSHLLRTGFLCTMILAELIACLFVFI